MAKFTTNARLRSDNSPSGRVRREVEEGTSSNITSVNDTPLMEIGSKIKNLDLHLMSNCSVDRAEMVVSSCVESETEDFAETHPILEKG